MARTASCFDSINDGDADEEDDGSTAPTDEDCAKLKQEADEVLKKAKPTTNLERSMAVLSVERQQQGAHFSRPTLSPFTAGDSVENLELSMEDLEREGAPALAGEGAPAQAANFVMGGMYGRLRSYNFLSTGNVTDGTDEIETDLVTSYNGLPGFAGMLLGFESNNTQGYMLTVWDNDTLMDNCETDSGANTQAAMTNLDTSWFKDNKHYTMEGEVWVIAPKDGAKVLGDKQCEEGAEDQTVLHHSSKKVDGKTTTLCNIDNIHATLVQVAWKVNASTNADWKCAECRNYTDQWADAAMKELLPQPGFLGAVFLLNEDLSRSWMLHMFLSKGDKEKAMAATGAALREVLVEHADYTIVDDTEFEMFYPKAGEGLFDADATIDGSCSPVQGAEEGEGEGAEASGDPTPTPTPTPGGTGLDSSSCIACAAAVAASSATRN